MAFFRMAYHLNESVLLYTTPCGPYTPIIKRLCPLHSVEPFISWSDRDTKYDMLFEHHIFDPDFIGEFKIN